MAISDRVSNVLPQRRGLEAKWARYKGMFHQLRANPLTAIGILIVVVFVAVALLTPVLMPGQGQDPYQMPRDWETTNAPPGTAGHLLGTNSNGGDVLYGILWGARLSIGISLSVVLLTSIFGTIVGGIAGYVGGFIDELIMRIVDAMISIPAIVWAIAVVTALGPSYFNIGVALTTMLWGTYARIIRGEVIHVKNEDYIAAARIEGVSEISIFFKEVIPNAIPPIFVQSSLYFGRVVLIAASVAFIGLAEPGIAEWGRIIAMGQNGLLAGRWWVSVFPGFAIFFWAFGWNMIGDGLRDVIDPRTETH
jgi:peptide/nickel transport system permease protein